MPRTITASLAEVIERMRTGDLAAATERIQAALRGRTAAPPPAPGPRTRGPVVDLVPAKTRTGAPRATPTTAGRFEARRHAGAYGGLDYRLYVPPGARPGMPLVVMLHGCTQTPEDFATGAGMNRLADRHGVLVAYPAQSQSANAQRCWNWFRPGDQARDRGEPALIAGIAREVMAEHAVDAGRVFVAGLSAGGAAAAIMAAAYPDLFAAVGVHSGLAHGAAHDLPSALAAMKGPRPGRRSTSTFVPLITFHGDRDATVAETNSAAIIAATLAGSDRLTHTEERGTSAGGRSWTRSTHKDEAGRSRVEQWTIHGAGHAWSGGDAAGSYTDPLGPDASAEMLRFFLAQRGPR